MGILNRLRNAARAFRSGLANPERWLVDALGGEKLTSGVSVTEASALKYPAVYAAVRVIAETVASLPLKVYKRLPNGDKEEAAAHPVSRLLRLQPNPHMSSMVLRETGQGHLLTWGNAYILIERDRAMRPAELWPLAPDRTRPETVGGQLRYVFRYRDGREARIPAENMLHVPGLGFDGYVGYSPIRLAREAIGLGKASEQFGAALFGNGSRPAGVLQHPGELSPDAVKRLRTSWESRHGGPTNQHKTAILQEGMTWQSIGIPPEDAQFLETRKFQIAEIARIYRVPPHLLGDLERATFSNIEAQGIEFVVHCIRPWLVRWEQELNRKLFSQKAFFAEHTVDGLLRGDIVSRYRAYSTGFQNGFLSQNDIRRLENLNRIEEGDTYFVPMNLQTTEKANKEPEPIPAALIPTATGDEAEGDGDTDEDARTRVLAAHRPLLEDAWSKIVRAEMRVLASKPDRWQAWLSEGHAAWACGLLEPIIAAVAGLLGREDILRILPEYVRAAVDNHISIARLASEGWAETRPAEAAGAILWELTNAYAQAE